MAASDKVRENKARRAAKRRGWRLKKARRRDALATDFGEYVLLGNGRRVVTRSIETVERVLNGEV